MVSRTTDDYRRMAQAGCVAITEPAFWAGFDRSSPAGFYDYFRQLTDVEPKRAAQYGIAHYCWLCINPKEAEDPAFAREVMKLIPEFLDKPNVLGIGEIGLNKNSRNELIILEEQIELAKQHERLILVHTPHLEDKLKGTRMTMDALVNAGIDPGRVLIDHVEEHTVAEVLDRGFWAGMTLYPDSKCTPNEQWISLNVTAMNVSGLTLLVTGVRVTHFQYQSVMLRCGDEDISKILWKKLAWKTRLHFWVKAVVLSFLNILEVHATQRLWPSRVLCNPSDP